MSSYDLFFFPLSEISDSSSSDGESPSGRSSSRVSGHNDTAKPQTSPERAAHVRMPLLTRDGVVNSRSRLTDDAVEEGKYFRL